MKHVVAVGEREEKQQKKSWGSGDNHWKWQDSRGAVLGANKTRRFIIGSLGATRRRGVEM